MTEKKAKYKTTFATFNITVTLLQVRPLLENGKRKEKKKKIFHVNFGCFHNAWECNRWQVNTALCPQGALWRFALTAIALLVLGSPPLLKQTLWKHRLSYPPSFNIACAMGETVMLTALLAPRLQSQLVIMVPCWSEGHLCTLNFSRGLLLLLFSHITDEKTA